MVINSRRVSLNFILHHPSNVKREVITQVIHTFQNKANTLKLRNILKIIELKNLNKAESSCKTCIIRSFVSKYRFITLLEGLRCLKVPMKKNVIKRKI